MRARAGDADNHLPILRPARGEFEIAAADEIEAARVFALREERRLRWQRYGARWQFEVGQHGAAQRAEPAGTAIGASRATDGSLHRGKSFAASATLPLRFSYSAIFLPFVCHPGALDSGCVGLAFLEPEPVHLRTGSARKRTSLD